MFPIIVKKNSASSSSQYADWILPASLDISYSKGGGAQFSKLFDLQIKDFSLTHGAGDLKIIFSISSFAPATNELGNDFQLNSAYILQLADFGKMYHLHLDFLAINLLLAGMHTGNLNIQVLAVTDDSLVEEKNIPINLSIVDSGEIINNLSPDVNFCLDPDLFFKLTSDIAKFVKVTYAISYKNKVHNLEYQYALLDGSVTIPMGEAIQPYIYLSEEEINLFFTANMLDMKPANVEIEVYFYDETYDEITHYQLGNFLFHAGYSKKIPLDGSVTERSLSYNSHLPLAYRFGGQFIDFKFRGKTNQFDKQQYSTPTSVFQTMFIQKYHFNDVVGGAFSPGFSSGFLTTEALLNANPFYLYKEGYINEIVSDYTIKGINFPWEINSYNVVWLDDNNNFNAIAFTGNRDKENSIQQVINQYAKDFRYKKAGTIRDNKLKLNTGWKLASEIKLINSLIDAKRAWIFKDNPADRIEIVCTSEKFPEEVSQRELVEFNLEFNIND